VDDRIGHRFRLLELQVDLSVMIKQMADALQQAVRSLNGLPAPRQRHALAIQHEVTPAVDHCARSEWCLPARQRDERPKSGGDGPRLCK
jgi:hypothetical protein